MAKRKIVFLLYVLAGIALLLLSLQCHSRKPAEEPNTSMQKTWLNLGDSAHYVGMNTCRKCHDDIYQSFKNTGMGHSFGIATMTRSAADFHVKKPIYDKYKNFYYQPFWKDSSLYIMEYRLQGKDTVHKRVEKVSYIIGSGHHTNSHIINTNGYLNQAPFTWYVQKGQWDLPPGFEGGYNTRFSRSLGQECLTCHNGYPTAVPGSLNKYSYIPVGIDCERCHGPGSLHVAQKMKGQVVDIRHDTDFTIVNPAKVPYELQIDICQRCHLQGDAVLKNGKTFYDFRPGMKLSSVMDVYMPVYENQNHGFLMASHAVRLRRSPCFIQTHKPGSAYPAMTCITCHNPHVSVKVTPKQYFIAKCMDCHKDAHSRTPEVLKTKGQDCLSCHMPKSGAIDIPHVTITDHYIRVVKKDDPKISLLGVGKFEGLKNMTDSTPSALIQAKAYLYFYEKFEHKPQMLDSAWQYVRKYPLRQQPALYIYYYYLKGNWQQVVSSASVQKGMFDDAVINYQVAQSYMNLDKYQEALPYLQKAVQQLPYELDYRIKLGTAYLLMRNMQAAREQFDFVIKEDPKLEAAWNNLGFLELVDGKADSAMQDLQKAIALNPDYTPARINMAKVWLARNNIAQAEAVLENVLKTEPRNADAQQLLALIKQSAP